MRPEIMLVVDLANIGYFPKSALILIILNYLLFIIQIFREKQ
jgi:hypothetical protein